MNIDLISSIKNLFNHRYLVILLIIFSVECIASLVLLAVLIQPTELQVVVHYTGFGSTNFYRDKWIYLLTFPGFVLISYALYVVLTYRILVVKGNHLAAAVAWLGIFTVAVASVFFYQILKIASLS